MKQLLFMNLILFLFTTNNKSPKRNPFLEFENFKEEKIFFPEDNILYKKTIHLKDATFWEDKKLNNIPFKQKITGGIFNFICNLNLINRWNSFKEIGIDSSNERQRYIKIREKELSIFYCGEIELIKDHKSLLFMVIDGEQNRLKITRNLFMLNIDLESKLKSVTLVASYFYFNGVSACTYTKKIKKGKYVQIWEDLSSDINSQKEEKERNILRIHFHYNKNGYLIKKS